MGMYDQICPSCGATNSVSDQSCACGYVFSADTGSYEAAELAFQEEEAYVEYIRARSKELKKALGFAESDVVANPGNPEKVQVVDNIKAELKDLKVQYEEQKTRLKASEKVLNELRAEKERLEAEARAKAEAERKRKEAARKKAEAEKRAREQAKREAEERKRKEAEARKKAEEEKKRAAEEAKQAKLRAKEEAKLAKQHAKEEAKRKKQQAAEAKKRQEDILRQAEEHARQEAIRRKQEKEQQVRDKAERNTPKSDIFNRAKQAMETARQHLSQRPDPLPDDEFEDDGFEDSGVPEPTHQECPVCTAELPLGATVCGCGYQFGDGAEAMPELETGDFFQPSVPDAPEGTQQCPICTAEVPLSAAACNCGYEFPSGETTMPGLSLDGNKD